MKVLRVVLVLMLTTGLGIGQRGSSGHWPDAPMRNAGKVEMTIDRFDWPTSLEELTKTADLIVRVLVTELLPPRWLDPKVSATSANIDTDVVLSVQEVLKGLAGSGEKIIVEQAGGTIGELVVHTPQVRQMKPGETYVLFLETEKRKNLPDHGMRRFMVVGTWSGLFAIERGLVRAPSPSVCPGLASYESKGVDSLLAAIRQNLATFWRKNASLSSVF